MTDLCGGSPAAPAIRDGILKEGGGKMLNKYRKPPVHVVGLTSTVLKGFGSQLSDIFISKFNP